MCSRCPSGISAHSCSVGRARRKTSKEPSSNSSIHRGPSGQRLSGALAGFLRGNTTDPPAFSALKVGGKRAYNLARKGVAVELKPRPVMIHSLAMTRYEYPELTLDIRCGSGTYVRSLGRDIARETRHRGRHVRFGAARDRSVPTRRCARPLRDSARNHLSRHLRPAVDALPGLPQFELTEQELASLWQGRQLDNRLNLAAAEIAALDPQGVWRQSSTVAENGAVAAAAGFSARR